MKEHLNGNGFFTRKNTVVETSVVLLQAIKDLVPELIVYPSLILKMNRAIFFETSRRFNLELREISSELKRIVKPENSENLEYFMTVLKGMQIMARKNGLKSSPELSDYIEQQLKEVMQVIPQKKAFQNDEKESSRKVSAKGKSGRQRSDMA